MKTRRSCTARGFSLVEVTLALGVAGFCLVAIFGLLPVALNSNQAAIQQTAAESVLTAVVSDLRATPPVSPTNTPPYTSGQYAISIPAAPAAGKTTTTTTTQTLYFVNEQQLTATAASALYRATVTFFATPSGGGTRTAIVLNVKVSWPATVDPASGTPAGIVQTFTALDRN